MATTQGDIGAAHYAIEISPDGAATVAVRRAYPSGLAPSTADHVWRIVADFGGVKRLFPSLLRVYLTYPDAGSGKIGLVRDMTFAPPPNSQDLAMGIENLVEYDETARKLAYTSVLGLPVEDYRSGMSVVGSDACELAWVSTCRVSPTGASFLPVLASILAGGANQIATELGLP